MFLHADTKHAALIFFTIPVAGSCRTQFRTLQFGRLQASLGTGTNHLEFVFRDGGQNMDGQLIRGRVVGTDEFDVRLLQAGDQVSGTGETVELRHDQSRSGLLTAGDGLGQLGSVVVAARLDLGSAVDHGRTESLTKKLYVPHLSVDAVTGATFLAVALFLIRDAVISDDFFGFVVHI